MACNTQRFKLDIRNILLGKQTKHETCITTKAGTSLGGKFWVFHEPNTQAKRYVWYNTGTSVDPAVPGATGVEVDILVGDSAAQVATKTATALSALTGVVDSAVATGNEIKLVMAVAGPCFPSRDALATAAKTGFAIATRKQGWVQVDLGPTNGDITLTLEESLQDVTSPQTGDFLLAQIRRGFTGSAEFELKDVSAAQLQRLLLFSGEVFITDDADQKIIGGLGQSKLFTSKEDAATQLVFRPSNKVADADPSEDITMPFAVLSLGELVFSAENEAVYPVTATPYLKEGMDPKANFLIFGDAAKVI